MSKSFDAIMKIIEETGSIPDEKAKAIIDANGPLEGDERKQIASAIKMKRALESKEGEPGKADESSADEVSMDDYLQALSVLDSDEASGEEKKKAQQIKDKFEG
nr:hypothetical protein [Anaerolineae bacterium]